MVGCSLLVEGIAKGRVELPPGPNPISFLSRHSPYPLSIQDPSCSPGDLQEVSPRTSPIPLPLSHYETYEKHRPPSRHLQLLPGWSQPGRSLT